ncbi:hypothetical protein BSKO_13129 [Bryopsis sp. KO-2023]|nr:hypothetical protein BSKO_13129 [Bryopsis sp. KO-2023]
MGWGRVSVVLQAAPGEEGSESQTVQSDISDDDLADRLSRLGVELSTSDSREDRLRCCELLSEEDFWRTNYALHSNKKRVKNWLWVHQRYRRYLEGLVATAENAVARKAADETSKVETALKKIKSDFNKLAGKIDSHSEFEDTQLFKFFLENEPECESDVKHLMEEHADGSFDERVRSAISAGVEGIDEVAAAIEDYVEWMKSHMEGEERALVRRWLSLSKESYKKYRSNLSWKWAMVY